MTQIFRTTILALLGVAATMPAWAQGQPAPKYSAKVPPYITTPDTVETRIGTLKFFDGLPDHGDGARRSTTISTSRAVSRRFSAAYRLRQFTRPAKA